MKKLKKVLQYINTLEENSFDGWNDDQINAYLTACTSIKEKINEVYKITVDFKKQEDEWEYGTRGEYKIRIRKV